MSTYKAIFVLIVVFNASISYSAERLRFDWRDAKAEITEIAHKKGNQVKVKYLVHATPVDGGFIVNQSEVEVLEINGITSFSDSARSTIIAAKSLPPIKIDEFGNPIEIIDFDKYIDRLTSIVNKTMYTQMVKDPEMRQLIAARTMENWCYWVCLWTDDRISEEKPLIEKDIFEMMGMRLPQTSITTNHGRVGDSEIVKLTYEDTKGGEQPVSSLVESLSRLADKEIPNKNNAQGTMEITKKTLIQAFVEPTTLKPSRVVAETTTQVSGEGKQLNEFESKEFVFDWQ